MSAISTFSNVFTFGLGAQTEWYLVKNTVGDLPMNLDLKEKFFLSYHAYLRLDNRDDPYYPTTGTNFFSNARLISDNGFQLRDKPAALAFHLRWESVFPLGNKLVFLPGIYARYLASEDLPLFFTTTIGGDSFWEVNDTHLPFTGLRYGEYSTQNSGVFLSNIPWKIADRHYLYFKLNVAYTSNENEFWKGGNTFFGGGITYSFDTFVGPMEFTLFASGLNDKVYSFINIGKKF